MSFKLKSYKELLAMTKEKLDEAMVPLRAASAKAQINVKIAKLDEEIATLESNTQELASAKDINFDAIADNIDQIALKNLRRERYVTIDAELFPAEVAPAVAPPEGS